LLVFFSVVGFYGWTALSPHSGQKINGVWSEYFYQRAPSGYEQLTDAFLHGRLSMTELPKLELLALTDPYDPVANGQLRHHDWVLFEGKYYLYWSPLPALLLFVPASVLGLPMNSALACIFLGSTLLASLLALLSKIGPNFLLRYPLKATLLTLILGFGSYTPILLRRPAAYEVAILTGSTFAALAMLLFLQSESAEKMKFLWASMAVLSSMLSFWSRPSFLFVPILIVGFIVFNNRFNVQKIIFPIGAPVVAVASIIGLYNYLRFNSISEFGARYQLAGVRPTKFSVSWIIPKIQSDFGAYRFFDFFPWTTTGDSPFRGKLYPAYNIEPNLGLFVVLPWALIICIVSWQKRDLLRQGLNNRLQVLIIACCTAAGAWLIQLALVSGTTWRYLGDFAPFYLLVILALFMAIESPFFELRLSLRWVMVLALLLIAFKNEFRGVISIVAFSLCVFAFIAPFHRHYAIRLNKTGFLLTATLWTVGMIGLTSLTVGGLDPFKFFPCGFNWWEIC